MIAVVLALAATTASATHVSLQLRDHAPLVVVKVSGLEVPLVFDTGDQSTVALQPSVLERIKAVPTGDSSELHQAKGDPVHSASFRLARLEIGQAVFTDFIGRADIHDPSYPANDVGQKGFLGTGLFKSYEVIIDYTHRRLTLIPRATGSSASESCRGTAVPFASEWHGEPVTAAGTDLGPVTLWWDTGAPGSVLSKRFVHNSRPELEEEVKTRRFTLGGVDFGPWTLGIWDANLPPGFNGAVGYDFFARHLVCLDFPDRQVVIRR